MLGRTVCSSFLCFLDVHSSTLDATEHVVLVELCRRSHHALNAFQLVFDMGNGSSTQYSQSRHYDYRPFTGPVIPPPSQMTNANSNGTGTGSTLPSYDMPRRRKKWFRFGKGRDRHRGQEVWYSAYVSPRGQQPPTPNIYRQFSFSLPKVYL
jgi:hypothetical protein